MGASYNTILVPTVEREKFLQILAEALGQLGHDIVHREEPAAYGRFGYYSVQMIFIGPFGAHRWLPISSWGDGLCPFREWFRQNPLAMELSRNVSPVVYLFSYDAGVEVGYSIFVDGRQVESRSAGRHPDLHLQVTTVAAPLSGSNILGELLEDPQFDYTAFTDNFRKGNFKNLELATAALAERLGLIPHLLDPYDIDDGDGGIVVERGVYKPVTLDGWMAVYYEMISEFADVFREFREAVPDQKGEVGAKIRIIGRLADNLDDATVASFFGKVVANRNEYDMARIEALKVLELHEAKSDELHRGLGSAIASVLESRDDELVQQWAGIAAAGYMNVDRVCRAVTERLISRDTELDLRYNCLAAVKRLGPVEPAVAILRRLLEDKELGPSAIRQLRDWGIE
jgi:hypothetical protein